MCNQIYDVSIKRFLTFVFQTSINGVDYPGLAYQDGDIEIHKTVVVRSGVTYVSYIKLSYMPDNEQTGVEVIYQNPNIGQTAMAVGSFSIRLALGANSGETTGVCGKGFIVYQAFIKKVGIFVFEEKSFFELE